MNAKKKIQELFHKALHEGWTVKKLTLSVAVGMYIAFSPFPGAHLLMMIAFKLLLKLNFPILLIVASLNNPWTMIPMYSVDYAFGYWLLHHVLGLHPTFCISLHKFFGSGSICIWSFLVGGNIIGIVLALLSYPIFKVIFQRIALARRKETS